MRGRPRLELPPLRAAQEASTPPRPGSGQGEPSAPVTPYSPSRAVSWFTGGAGLAPLNPQSASPRLELRSTSRGLQKIVTDALVEVIRERPNDPWMAIAEILRGMEDRGVVIDLKDEMRPLTPTPPATQAARPARQGMRRRLFESNAESSGGSNGELQRDSSDTAPRKVKPPVPLFSEVQDSDAGAELASNSKSALSGEISGSLDAEPSFEGKAQPNPVLDSAKEVPAASRSPASTASVCHDHSITSLGVAVSGGMESAPQESTQSPPNAPSLVNSSSARSLEDQGELEDGPFIGSLGASTVDGKSDCTSSQVSREPSHEGGALDGDIVELMGSAQSLNYSAHSDLGIKSVDSACATDGGSLAVSIEASNIQETAGEGDGAAGANDESDEGQTDLSRSSSYLSALSSQAEDPLETSMDDGRCMISRLPDDVIIYILTLVVGHDNLRTWDVTQEFPSRQTMRLVCRRWSSLIENECLHWQGPVGMDCNVSFLKKFGSLQRITIRHAAHLNVTSSAQAKHFFRAIVFLKQLNSLDFTDSGLSDIGMAELVKALGKAKGRKPVIDLHLGGNLLTAASIDALVEANARLAVRALSLSGIETLSNKSFNNLLVAHGGLERLDVVKCAGLTHADIVGPALEHLNLSSNDHLSSMKADCAGLTVLNLSGCLMLTDEAVATIRPGCPRLKELNLNECSRLCRPAIVIDTLMSLSMSYCTDLVLPKIASLNLSRISLACCPALEDAVCADLCHGCPKLLELDCSGCAALSVPELIHGGIKSVNFSGCTELLASVLGDVAEHCPSLNELKATECNRVVSPTIRSTSLTVLDLAWCAALVDPEIDCPVLKSLTLSCCGMMTDTVVERVARGCTALTSLDLSCCAELEGPTLALERLEKLVLSGCLKITDDQVTLLCESCPVLSVLDLSGCNELENPVFSSQTIADLDLSDCETLVTPAFRLPKLQKVDLSRCSYLTDGAIEGLTKNSPLVENILCAECSCLSKPSFKCDNLESLILSFCLELSKPNIKAPKLLTLDMSGCATLQDKAVEAVCKGCPDLRHLNLNECTGLQSPKITPPLLLGLELAECSSLHNVTVRSRVLEKINFAHCPELTNAAIDNLGKTAPNLNELHVHNCNTITRAVVKLPKLKVLEMFCLSEWKEVAVTESCKKCPSLVELRVACCMALVTPKIEGAQLKKLDLSGCSQMTSPDLLCPKLERLMCIGCSSLTATAVETICAECPMLRILVLSYCTNLSEVNIRSESLEILDLCRCGELTDASVEAACRGCPNLLELVLSSCRRLSRPEISGAKLRKVVLSYCNKLSHPSISGESIERINLTCCARLSTHAVDQLCRLSPALRELELAGCTSLVNPVIQGDHLERVDLFRCSSLASPVIQGNSIAELVVGGCSQLTEADLEAARRRCPSLREIITAVYGYSSHAFNEPQGI